MTQFRSPLPPRPGGRCSRTNCHQFGVVSLRRPTGALVSYCLGHSDGHAAGEGVALVWLHAGMALCPRCRRVTPHDRRADHFTPLGERCALPASEPLAC